MLLVNSQQELKSALKSKDKIVINSDFINIDSIKGKKKKITYKYNDELVATETYAINNNIVNDESLIGSDKDTINNKEKAIAELEKICKFYKVRVGNTIGEISKSIFNKVATYNIKADKYILVRMLGAYNGGVIMRPKKSCYNNVYEYDMRSAYPYQLATQKFMQGEFFIYDKPVSELYIISILFDSIKIKNNVYDILENIKIEKQKNKYILTITSLEYKYIIKNYEIKGLELNYIINSTIIDYIDDGDFVKTFYTMKKEAKSKSEKTASKLILNALTGKLAQRLNYIIDRDIREETLAFSIFINAYQRLYIASIINKNIKDIIYSDTDSLFSTKKLNIKIGGDIGNWKLESKYKKIKLFSKRVYIASAEKDEQHIAGLSTILNKKDYKNLYQMQKNQFYNIKNYNKRGEFLGDYTIINKVE